MEGHWGLAIGGSTGVPKKAQEKLLESTAPVAAKDLTILFGDASTMEWPSRTVTVVEWRQPKPRRQIVCATEGGVWEVTKALRGAQRLWVDPGIEFWVIFMVGVWFCFFMLRRHSVPPLLKKVREYVCILYRGYSWRLNSQYVLIYKTGGFLSLKTFSNFMLWCQY